jgi:hypothetical protein
MSSFEVSGFPLSTTGLDGVEIVFSNGEREPLRGFVHTERTFIESALKSLPPDAYLELNGQKLTLG